MPNTVGLFQLGQAAATPAVSPSAKRAEVRPERSVLKIDKLVPPEDEIMSSGPRDVAIGQYIGGFRNYRHNPALAQYVNISRKA